MPRFTSDTVFDAGLDVIAESTRMTVCDGQPANFAGIAAVALASGTLDPGDFSLADGDVSGRKVVCAAQADLGVTADGEANHVAFDDGTTLLHVTVLPSPYQQLVDGNTASIASFDVLELRDPVAP